MKKAIWSIFEHRSGSHKNCGDWCPSNSGKGDPNKNVLPKFVLEIIKPVFTVLSGDKLPDKCLHGGTQNTNDITTISCGRGALKPRGRHRLELATYDATIVFNDGEAKIVDIYQQLGLSHGYY